MRSRFTKAVCAALVLTTMTAVLPAGNASAATAKTSSSASASSSKTSSDKKTAKKKDAEAQTVKFGKVTAVGKTSVTAQLGEITMPETDKTDKTKKSDKSGKKDSDKKMPEMPADFKGSGKPSDMPFGGGFPGGPAGKFGDKDGKGFDIADMITWGEEKTTIDLSKVTLTKDGKTAKISDIAKDDILTLVYKDDVLTEVKIGADMGRPDGGKRGQKNTKSKTDTTKTTPTTAK